MIYLRIFAVVLIVIWSSSCSMVSSDRGDKEKSDHLLLNYSDFGPPQLAEEILGKYRWQWSSPENHQPQAYEIKVVIYRDANLDSVKKMYSISEKNRKDYRYLSYDDARVWLKQKIDFFEADIASGDESNLALMYPFLRKYYLTLIFLEANF